MSSADRRRPLVSIGIPTYQRAGTLPRALASAQAQNYEPLEIVVCDNASGDDTESIVRSAAARDPRIRYLRNEHNIGPTANFNRLFSECGGEYVMMLADDDWLDDGYVARCAAVLGERPDVALAAGRARYVRDERVVEEGSWHRHLQDDPGARVISYFSTVRDNGVFYGLMRGAALRRAGAMPNVLGNDWLQIGRIVVQGAVEMVDDVHINRELGGTSVDVQSILSTFGQSSWQARVPQLVMAWEILRDVGSVGAPYGALPAAARRRVALRAALGSIAWPDLAWHLVTPTVAALARRPRGRCVWQGYLRATGALGAAPTD